MIQQMKCRNYHNSLFLVFTHWIHLETKVITLNFAGSIGYRRPQHGSWHIHGHTHSRCCRWLDNIVHEIEWMSDHAELIKIETMPVVPHIKLVVIGGYFIHFSNILCLSFVHICKIYKNISFCFLFAKYV